MTSSQMPAGITDNTDSENTGEVTRELMNSLRRAAMDFQARREHSRYELAAKLRGKFPDCYTETIDAVLDKLEADKLLSDVRFTEAYIRYRKSKGYGPVFIRHHLNGCKVPTEIINEQLYFDDPDWEEILSRLVEKKSSRGKPARGSKDFQRIQRFLLSRGFNMEQVLKLWR
jgi:regulatory protein